MVFVTSSATTFGVWSKQKISAVSGFICVKCSFANTFYTTFLITCYICLYLVFSLISKGDHFQSRIIDCRMALVDGIFSEATVRTTPNPSMGAGPKIRFAMLSKFNTNKKFSKV